MGNDCIFCKIAERKIPSKIVYEDEAFVGFADVNPQAPTHILVIPREHIETVNDLTPEHALLLGRWFLVGQKLAQEHHVDEAGYRLVVNCNRQAGQSVFHIHMHLLGGRPMHWPPG